MRSYYGALSEVLNLYDFSATGKTLPYRNGYRERMDGLALDAGQRVTLLIEAERAFSFNTVIFAELAERHWPETEHLHSRKTAQQRPGSHQQLPGLPPHYIA